LRNLRILETRGLLDRELGGVPIPQVDFPGMLYASANRDEPPTGPTAETHTRTT